ncbi:MAG: T9SS type A sorting domain-containing protein [bacterium]
MFRKTYFITAILIPLLALATTQQDRKVKLPDQLLATGSEVTSVQASLPPYPLPSPFGTDQIVGDTMVIGTTWYESQHNGTIGRMVEKDPNGCVHFVWMKGLDPQSQSRHIYYNYVDSTGEQGWLGEGTAVESMERAGYTTLDVGTDGKAFPAFHMKNGTFNFHSAIAADFFLYAGAFQIFEAPLIYYPYPADLEVIWPKMQLDRNQRLHMFATENPAGLEPGRPQRQYYISATYVPWTMTYDSTWTLIDWTMTIAGDIVTSEVSDKIALAWTYPLDPMFPDPLGDYSQIDNDIWILIDDDGYDLDPSQAFNLTDFYPPDSTWLPDTTWAQQDTHRAYTDLSLFIDQNDIVHIAFTTSSYFALEGTSYWNTSIVWHWSEEHPDDFFTVAYGWEPENMVYCGAWQLRVQRPSLGQDPNTGHLFCTYQVYDVDTTHLSWDSNPYNGWGMPSGEVFVSKSETGGMSWSEGINISNTITPSGAPSGSSLSELCPTMAKLVDDTCHIMYVLDRDAGFYVQEEGNPTLNEVVYHKVPVDAIPSTPTVPRLPFHFGDPVVNESNPRFQPKEFALRQNYPNPFNPGTSISFSLDQVSPISLAVYNLKGEQVAQIASGTYGSGQHTVTFDATDLSSGVYVYKLQAGERSLARKMLLVK